MRPSNACLPIKRLEIKTEVNIRSLDMSHMEIFPFDQKQSRNSLILLLLLRLRLLMDSSFLFFYPSWFEGVNETLLIFSHLHIYFFFIFSSFFMKSVVKLRRNSKNFCVSYHP